MVRACSPRDVHTVLSNIWIEQRVLGPEKSCLLIPAKCSVFPAGVQPSLGATGLFGELTVKIKHLPPLESFRAGPCAQHGSILLQSASA